MHIFGAAMLSASLFVTAAFAEPLVPGYPAGVQKARMSAGHTVILLGVGAGILLGVAVIAFHASAALVTPPINGEGIIAPPPVSTLSTSTTSTTS